MAVAFLDVHYRGRGARAACVVADAWEADSPSATYTEDIETVQPYEPGSFYRRELPCLLQVLRRLPSPVDTVVIDGYVWLPPLGRPGLGAHLREALDGRVCVVGIAKTAFAGAKSCGVALPVLRGTSRNPLFVTAAGMDVEAAVQRVSHMAGKYRIPTLARLADQLCRSKT